MDVKVGEEGREAPRLPANLLFVLAVEKIAVEMAEMMMAIRWKLLMLMELPTLAKSLWSPAILFLNTIKISNQRRLLKLTCYIIIVQNTRSMYQENIWSVSIATSCHQSILSTSSLVSFVSSVWLDA